VIGSSSARPNFLSRAVGRMAGHFGPVVLMYHSVEATSGVPSWRWAVSLQRFREQIDYLISEGWSFLRLDGLRCGEAAQSKQVVVTFDDAYSDTLRAAEVLMSGSLTASWFVVSTAMAGKSTWIEENTSQRPTLCPPQLRDLALAGMEIGGHSRTHTRLAQIETSELESETAQCKKEIEDALGGRITSFSYPYGSYNAAVMDAVRRAGFERACTTENGSAFEGGRAFSIRRLAVTADNTLSDFARKLFLLNDHAGIRGLVRSARRWAGQGTQ
jgi:peptidoglycan/xylan/chitin deacetylase (PgdA/CDA1 family)